MLASLVLLVLLSGVAAETEQRFKYVATDQILVNANDYMKISLSLITSADEYLEQASLSVILNLTQAPGIHPSFPYNVFFFDAASPEGYYCYNQFVNTMSVNNTATCSTVFNKQISCIGYMQCLSQSISYALSLSDLSFNEGIIVIQNPSNSSLILNTNMEMSVSANNRWFYLAVALTIILLTSLVVLTGVGFYWSLRYKKTKKMYEQFKLTSDVWNKYE